MKIDIYSNEGVLCSVNIETYYELISSEGRNRIYLECRTGGNENLKEDLIREEDLMCFAIKAFPDLNSLNLCDITEDKFYEKILFSILDYYSESIEREYCITFPFFDVEIAKQNVPEKFKGSKEACEKAVELLVGIDKINLINRLFRY